MSGTSMGTYTHLTAEKRGMLMTERQTGSSGAAIARMLARSKSTGSRELRRNASEGGVYMASVAAQAYRTQRRRCVRSRRSRSACCRGIGTATSLTGVQPLGGGNVVERKSRFVVLCKRDDRGAWAVLESFTRQMKRLPAFLRQSLTTTGAARWPGMRSRRSGCGLKRLIW